MALEGVMDFFKFDKQSGVLFISFKMHNAVETFGTVACLKYNKNIH